MKTKIILSLFVALFVSVFALNLSETANADPANFNYTVYVRNAGGSGVAGATVTLTGKDYHQIQTSGSNGKTIFTGVTAGTYSVTACYQGSGRMYQDFELPGGFGSDLLVLEPNVTFCPSW